jgi:hypothetical protein
MWDFKLKKIRIILLASIIWGFLGIWLGVETGGGMGDWLGWMTPVLIYWIVIPLYRWMMKGK